MERAARFEIQRHAAVLSSGGTIVQETRHFHEEDGSTTSGRIKDNAEDYRYFPEPDLVPVAPARAWVEELRARAARDAAGAPQPAPRGVGRLRARHAVDAQRGRGRPDRRHDRGRGGRRPAPASGGWASWPATPTSRASPWTSCPITPAQVARVAALVAAGDLNDKLARQVIEGVLAGEGDPDAVVEKRGLKVVSDEGALGAAVDEAIAGNAAIADKIRGGKVAAVGALVGAVMKTTRGQADAARVKELILERLGVEG